MLNDKRGPVAGHDEQPHTVNDGQSVEQSDVPVNAPDWMTQRQLAAHWQCSVATILRIKPPRHMLGMSPRYLRSEVDAWLASRGAK